MPKHRCPLLLAVALGLGLGAAGGAERKKIGECNALIGVINGGVDKIQQGTRAVPDAGMGGKDLRDMADAMDQIAADAAKQQLTLPELAQLAKDYEAMSGEVAAAARELATAYEKVDDEQMKKAQARMEKAVQREEPLVDSINKLCRAP
jgi:methyl-accepting chemotaxis protein